MRIIYMDDVNGKELVAELLAVFASKTSGKVKGDHFSIPLVYGKSGYIRKSETLAICAYIAANDALKNGLVPVEVSEDKCAKKVVFCLCPISEQYDIREGSKPVENAEKTVAKVEEPTLPMDGDNGKKVEKDCKRYRENVKGETPKEVEITPVVMLEKVLCSAKLKGNEKKALLDMLERLYKNA